MDNYVLDTRPNTVLTIHLILKTNYEANINVVGVHEKTETYEAQIIALLIQ